MPSTTETSTASSILAAARNRLLADGFAGLSTRKVANEAGVPLSQVHYHFGSKSGLVLAVLQAEEGRRLARQAEMYAEDEPLWRRYERACDFLDDDIESGYVRVLQELMAAAWSNPELAEPVRAMQAGWYKLLTEVAKEAADRFSALGPFAPAELATLVGCAFLGGEELLLLGFGRNQLPIRAALRRFGQLIREVEESAGAR